MQRVRNQIAPAPKCPDCSGELRPDPRRPDGSRYLCADCRGAFRVERIPPPDDLPPADRPSPGSSPGLAPAGSAMLRWRGLILGILEAAYWSGTVVLTVAILLLGGLLPVLAGWLRDEINSWGDVVERLGGAWFRVEPNNPDADLGPVISRVDAPPLFEVIDAVARRLGVKPPGQVRLSYLPCCGVIAWGRSRALLVGLPLLRILTRAEMRAVLAHEMAHLARGDATRAARRARFVEALERAVERRGDRLRGPLGAWARHCLREASWLIRPVARGLEVRADRSAALIAGGGAASSALVKTAVVQPLFREVLAFYDPETADANLYAFFRAFWFRLPEELRLEMRLRVLVGGGPPDPAHPPLPDRLALLRTYPDHVPAPGDDQPATAFLGDPELFEEMLHLRLFPSSAAVEPSVFHRNRS